jgi:hypothetical protein
MTTQEFIEKSKAIHGDRYDYSKAAYVDASRKVTIICPVHGEFIQRASHHTRGIGCPTCANDRRSQARRLTQEGFLRKARALHGQKYDYSDATYVDAHAKVKIRCPEHGIFRQAATTHLSGSGCPACAGRPECDTASFVERARATHSDRYDYSQTVYRNSVTKVEIICAEHGSFWQTPANHLQGNGCRLCGLKNAGQYHKKNTASFVVEAQKVHGHKYDYSLAEYDDARKKVTIICPKHGPFQQVAHVHLRSRPGEACRKCSYEQRGERAKLAFDEFLSKARRVHRHQYDYSKSEKSYVDAATPIEIVCPEHGTFLQTPANHCRGQGCPECAIVRIGEAQRKSTEQFIEEAHLVHGDIYDYSRTKYFGAREKLTIICPVDGRFQQVAGVHLRGTGCPKCSRRQQGAPRNLTRALRGEFDDGHGGYMYIVRFRLPCFKHLLYKVGSGTGKRLQKVVGEIRRIGATNVHIDRFDYASKAEAIVVEHLAHIQIKSNKAVVPPEYKFPGYSEVFDKRPDLKKVMIDPTLRRFQAGERWDPRDLG